MVDGWIEGRDGGMKEWMVECYLSRLVIFVFSNWQLLTVILSLAGPNESDANHSHPTSLRQLKNCSIGLWIPTSQQFPSRSERGLEGRSVGELNDK